MLVIIDLMGDDETVIVGGEAKETNEERIKREQRLREIAERAPQPQIVPAER